MSPVEDILKKAKRLGRRDRKKLLSALQVLDRPSQAKKPAKSKRAAAEEKRIAAMESFLKLMGSAHSDYTDVSTNKYKHLGEIYADTHEK